MMRRILDIQPETYQRHLIHGPDRIWAETNCYSDIIIELVHALGYEPLAALPFTLSIDFEGDQWTFFKFSHNDLFDLYGLEVYELAVWRPLIEHIEEQVALGRPVLVELDSFFLPDTAGTAYKFDHVKSSVAITEIDAVAGHMGYFHNQGYYHVAGEDFQDVLRLRNNDDPAILAPYVEFVKQNPALALQGADLLACSIKILQRQLRIMPQQNPFEKFIERFRQDFQWLKESPIEQFHIYSFATLRQFGACYELAASYLLWLQQQGEAELQPAIDAYLAISNSAKTMQFQLARAISRKKELDVSPLQTMAEHWRHANELLQKLYGTSSN